MNSSGVIPIDKRVLVKPDPPEERKGSIIMPEQTKQAEKYAKVKATLVAVGETAWSEAQADARNYGAAFTAPAPGDRVMIAKYGGIEIEGADGDMYRIMNDEDIIARLGE
jgi:chaperonin GroES